MTEEREFPDWESRYRDEKIGELPWFYADLDPDVEKALVGLGLEEGGVEGLDLGTGPGTQAIALAKRGFKMVATDVAEAAVADARTRAEKEGVEIDFVEDDILHSKLDRQFDVVLDRGVFHIFPHERRPDYLAKVACLIRAGGWLILKCFSEKETMEEGPYRFSPAQIREYFDAAFEIRSIEESVYYGTLDPMPKALFCIMQRKG